MSTWWMSGSCGIAGTLTSEARRCDFISNVEQSEMLCTKHLLRLVVTGSEDGRGQEVSSLADGGNLSG